MQTMRLREGPLRDFLPLLSGPDHSFIDDIVDFDGPPVSKIGDQPYVTLTQYGVKEEGGPIYPDGAERCWTDGEARWRFKQTFLSYLIANPSRQLAWRSRPDAEQGPDGDFVVRCRFALLGPIREAGVKAA